jgi:hypothetical protein
MSPSIFACGVLTPSKPGQSSTEFLWRWREIERTERTDQLAAGGLVRGCAVILKVDGMLKRIRAQTAGVKAGKENSNRRLGNLCAALQRERDPAKIQQIKNRLSHEFFDGPDNA